jgi:hypothetical protein
MTRLSGVAFIAAFVTITGACGQSESHDANTLHQMSNTVQTVVKTDSSKLTTTVHKDTSPGALNKIGSTIKSQVHRGAVKLANATQPADDKSSAAQKHLEKHEKKHSQS